MASMQDTTGSNASKPVQLPQAIARAAPSLRSPLHTSSFSLAPLLADSFCPNWTSDGGQLGGWFTLTVNPGRTEPRLTCASPQLS